MSGPPLDMRAGDILLFRVGKGSSVFSKLIGWGENFIHQAPTDASYCHAAIVGPTTSQMYEARWPKVHNVLIDWAALNKRNTVEVYRVKGATDEQIRLVLEYAEGRLGTFYDIVTILTLGVIQIGPAAVCSQFVWESWTFGDVILCPYAALESPDDLANSSRLVRIL